MLRMLYQQFMNFKTRSSYCSDEFMSLAFQLDAKVQKGYFAQHTYVGKLGLTATDKDVCVKRWIDMVRQANTANKDAVEAKPQQELGKILQSFCLLNFAIL